MYYGQHNNASLNQMFMGFSKNISMEEIYGIDYNSSIYHFTIPTWKHKANTTTTIDVTLQYFSGLEGSYVNPRGLLGLFLLSSNSELCATFFFLGGGSVKNYILSLVMYPVPNSDVSMSGFMSLPNQARSFDKFKLFEHYELPDNKTTVMEFAVTSLKFLQKRNTVAKPCIHVDNYDKVHKYLFR
jgi:hypothetical protein